MLVCPLGSISTTRTRILRQLWPHRSGCSNANCDMRQFESRVRRMSCSILLYPKWTSYFHHPSTFDDLAGKRERSLRGCYGYVCEIFQWHPRLKIGFSFVPTSLNWLDLVKIDGMSQLSSSLQPKRLILSNRLNEEMRRLRLNLDWNRRGGYPTPFASAVADEATISARKPSDN